MKRILMTAVVLTAASALAHTRGNDENDSIVNAKGNFETAQKYLADGRKRVNEGDRYYGGKEHFHAVSELDEALAYAKEVKSAKGKAQVKDLIKQAAKLREEALAESFDYVKDRVAGFIKEKNPRAAEDTLQDLKAVAEKDPRFKKLVAANGCGPDKQSPWMISCD